MFYFSYLKNGKKVHDYCIRAENAIKDCIHNVILLEYEHEAFLFLLFIYS